MEFKSLPDVASQINHLKDSKEFFSGLSWVGMEKVQMPISWKGQILSAEVKAQVDLSKGASRGIHMSRLYTLMSDSLTTRTLSWVQLEELVQMFIDSQNGISQAARIQVKFQLPLERKALKSGMKGWRLYPVEMQVMKSSIVPSLNKINPIQRLLKAEILYSSTCPASTALSRELWRQDLKTTFSENEKLSLQSVDQWFENQIGMPGTPHAQRSRAEVQVQLSDAGLDFGPTDLIVGIEESLQTPVQTLVKRIDEQEFARLNGQNPMFCEDAARKVQSWLNSFEFIDFYKGTFEHQESLHPHNAVAVIEKNKESIS